MASELERYTSGEVAIPHQDRKIAREAKTIFDRTRLKAYEADGAMALAAHLMDGLTDLDKHRKELAGEDISLNLTLTEIEATALQQCREVQRSLTRGWRF